MSSPAVSPAPEGDIRPIHFPYLHSPAEDKHGAPTGVSTNRIKPLLHHTGPHPPAHPTFRLSERLAPSTLTGKRRGPSVRAPPAHEYSRPRPPAAPLQQDQDPAQRMQAPLPPAKRIQLYCGHDLGQEVAHQLQSFVDGVKPLETVPMGSPHASLPAFIREQAMLGKDPRGIALAVAAALPLDPFFDVEGRRCPQPGHGPLHARVWCPCHMQSHSGNVGMTGTGWWRWAAVQAVRGTVGPFSVSLLPGPPSAQHHTPTELCCSEHKLAVPLPSTECVPRPCVCLAWEDPQDFASRLHEAHVRRLTRACSIVDSVTLSSDGSPPLHCLHPTQLESIRLRVLKHAGIRCSGRSLTPLLDEVSKQYSDANRALGRKSQFDGLPIVATKARAKVPETGCKFPSSVDVQRVSTVLWQSAALMAPVGRAALFASQDVIDWMSSQLVMRLDDRKYRLSELDGINSRLLVSYVDAVRSVWLPQLASNIRDVLIAGGKGWWNDASPTPHDIFSLTKSNRLHKRICCGIEYALSRSFWASLAPFTQRILQFSGVQPTLTPSSPMPSSKSVLLDISGLFGLPSVAVKPSTSPIFLMTATVKFSPATSLPMRATATAVHTPAAGDDDPTFEEEEDFTKHPLPSIDCALEPSIADVKTVLFRTIDESVGKLSTFPHIGPDIWPYVSWNRPLESVNPFPAFHDIISAHKAAIEAVLLSHAGPLEAVVGMVKELAIGLNSDVSGSLQRWQARIRGKTSLKLAPIVREIQAHRSAMESLSLQTPNTVAVGLFEVSLVHVKEQIWGTHSAHANGLLRLLSDWCDDTAEAISAQAGDIRSKVRARCKTVDEAMAAEAFCSNAPAYISKLNRGLVALFQAMDALDSFHYARTPRQLTFPWEVKADVSTLFTDIEMAKGSFPARRNHLKYELSQSFEQLHSDAIQLFQGMGTLQDINDAAQLKAATTLLEHTSQRLSAYMERMKSLNHNEISIGAPASSLPLLDRCATVLEPFFLLAQTQQEWDTWSKKWLSSPVMALNGSDVSTRTGKLNGSAARACALFDNASNVHMKALAADIVSEIESFGRCVPVITALRHPGLKDRHWEEMRSQATESMKASQSPRLPTGLSPPHAGPSPSLPFLFRDSSMTLSQAMDSGLLEYSDIIVDVATAASREHNVEQELESMTRLWSNTGFSLVPHAQSGSYIVRGLQDLLDTLDEHAVLTQTLLASPYHTPHATALRKWSKSLDTASDVIEEWCGVQRAWVQLWPLFQSIDLQTALPAEAKLFGTLHKFWSRSITAIRRGDGSILPQPLVSNSAPASSPTSANSESAERPTLSVMAFASTPMLMERLKECIRHADVIHKGLRKFLQAKRHLFPRFYFLADDEMLQLFSQGSDPLQVQPHLIRCFDGITALHFEYSSGVKSRSRSRRAKSSTGSALWARLSGPGEADVKEKRREGWKQSLQQSFEGTRAKSPHPPGDDTISNIRKLSAMGSERVQSLTKTAMSLMLAASLKKSKEEPSARLEVLSMVSGSGECVPLATRVIPELVGNALEKWMAQLEASMQSTVRILALDCVADDRRRDLVDWVKAWPSMSILTAVDVLWTHDIEEVFSSSTSPTADPKSLQHVLDSVLATLRQAAGLVRSGKVSSNQSITTSAIISRYVNARDVTAELLASGTTDRYSFDWQKILRSYVTDSVVKPAVREVFDVKARKPSDAPSVFGSEPAVQGRSHEFILTSFTDTVDTRMSTGIAAEAARFLSTGPTSSSPLSAMSTDGLTVGLDMLGCSLPYGCEYLGVAPRLVMTPLTIRCLRTCFGAVSHKFGTSLEGPAGTGKSETVKDLAKTTATRCIVFNCAESMDVVSMGNAFRGLAHSGAWACFDEFNRIDVEVLSVVAQQIVSLQIAARRQQPSLIFEGSELPLSTSFSVFITMNPGYAGRNLLPDNLKALFRPVAMVKPDLVCIADVILLSSGFEDSKLWGSRIVSVLHIMSVCLPSRKQFDFTLRMVRSVVDVCSCRVVDGAPECVTVVIAILSAISPRLLPEDEEPFRSIVRDVFLDFPAACEALRSPTPAHATSVLNTIITTFMQRRGLSVTQSLLDKASQLWETTDYRTGVLLLGPSGSGKSFLLSLLLDSLGKLSVSERSALGIPVPDHSSADGMPSRGPALSQSPVFPCALTLDQLFGTVDASTQEWRDGVFSSTFREACGGSKGEKRWLVCDGPIFAQWVENLNTLLDDSKRLTLVSGETIHLARNVSIVFETDDISHASPATISRCGIVHLDSTCVSWKNILAAWGATASSLPHVDDDAIAAVLTHASDVFPAFLDWYSTAGGSISRVFLCQHVLSLVSILLPTALPVAIAVGHDNIARAWKSVRAERHRLQTEFDVAGKRAKDAAFAEQAAKRSIAPLTTSASSSALAGPPQVPDVDEARLLLVERESCVQSVLMFACVSLIGGAIPDSTARSRLNDTLQRFIAERAGSKVPWRLPLNPVDVFSHWFDASACKWRPWLAPAPIQPKPPTGPKPNRLGGRPVDRVLSVDVSLAVKSTVSTPILVSPVASFDRQLSALAKATEVYQSTLSDTAPSVADDASFIPPLSSSLSGPDILVPNRDTLLVEYACHRLLQAGLHVMLWGPSSGKSHVSRSVITRLIRSPSTSKTISSHIRIIGNVDATSAQLLTPLVNRLERRRRGVLGPPNDKAMIVFIDDWAAPGKPSTFSESLRQIAKTASFRELASLEPRSIAKVAFLVTTNTAIISPVLVRSVGSFAALSLPPISSSVSVGMFAGVCSGLLTGRLPAESIANVSQVCSDAFQFLTSLKQPAEDLLSFGGRRTSLCIQSIKRAVAMLSILDDNQLKDSLTLAACMVHELASECVQVASVFFADFGAFLASLLPVRFGMDVNSFSAIACPALSPHDTTSVFAVRFTHLAFPAPNPFSVSVDPTPRSLRMIIDIPDSTTSSAVSLFSPGDDTRKSVEEEPSDATDFFSSDASRPFYGPCVTLTPVGLCDAVQSKLGRDGIDGIVLFPYLIDVILRIARVLASTSLPTRSPSVATPHNAIVMGTFGVGKRTAVELACRLCQRKVVRLEGAPITRSIWLDGIKTAMISAGIEKQPCVLLAVDGYDTPLTLWSDVSTFTSTGWIEGVLDPNEEAMIVESFRVQCYQQGLEPNALNAMSLFAEEVKRWCHVIAVLPSTAERVSVISSVAPQLFARSSVIQYQPWPVEALQATAQWHLEDCSSITSSLFDPATIANVCSTVHSIANDTLKGFGFITSATYFTFLNEFKTKLASQNLEIHSQIRKLEVAVSTVSHAQVEVLAMSAEIERLKPLLEASRLEALEVQKSVVADRSAAREYKETVERERAASAANSERMLRLAEETDRELQKVLPELDAATQSLRLLKRSDLDLLRAMARPPHGVRLTLEAVCVMFGLKPVTVSAAQRAKQAALGMDDAEDDNGYWALARSSLLSDPKELLRMLLEFDKDALDIRTIAAIQPYVEMEEFQPDVINRVSSACTAMCLWVRSMYTYFHVLQIVQPKRMVAAEAKQGFELAEAALSAAQSRLDDATSNLFYLEERHNALMDTEANLGLQIQRAQSRAENAEKLLRGLASQISAWTKKLDDLKRTNDRLIGDTCIAVACMVYAGPQPAEIRASLLSQWQSVVASALGCSPSETPLTACFSTEPQLRQWRIHGLPASDVHAVENAVILFGGRPGPVVTTGNTTASPTKQRPSINGLWTKKILDMSSLPPCVPLTNLCPLVIDPHGVGTRFIKRMCRGLGLLHEGALTSDISEGNGSDVRSPAVSPTLGSQSRKHHRLVGGMDILQHSNPHLSDVLQTCMLVGRWVLVEGVDSTPDSSLIEAAIACSRRWRKSGGTSPTSIGSVHPDFLLIMTCRSSHPVYPPEVAVNTCILDFSVSLSSLRESFAQTVCQHCLPAAEAQRDGLLQSVSELLQSMGDLEAELIRCLSESLGENLLEDAALLANVESCRVSSELVAKQLATAESAALALSSTRASLLPVADVCVSMFTALSSLRALNPMYEHSMAWFQWLLSDSLDATLDGTASDVQPQLLAFTTFRRDWESSHPDIDPSLRNSMVQSLRLLSERLVEAVTAGLYQEHRQIAAILLFASLHSSLCHLTPAVAAVWETILGRTPFTEDVHTEERDPLEQLCFTRFASPSSFLPSCATLALTTVGQCMSMALEGTMAPSLFSMFAYTSCRRPLLLLLSSGVDPLTDIQALAEAEGMTSGLTIVSLGRGQGTVAARAMRSAARTGGWVLLMNCHLLPSWFNGLEAVFDEVSAGVPHPTFRLLLTSASVDGFPMNLLQSSVRITVEAVSNPSLAIQSSVKAFVADRLHSEEWLQRPRELCGSFARMFWGLSVSQASLRLRQMIGRPLWLSGGSVNTLADVAFATKRIGDLLQRPEGISMITDRFLEDISARVDFSGSLSVDADIDTVVSVIASSPRTSGLLSLPEYDDSQSVGEALLNFVSALPSEIPCQELGIPAVAMSAFQLSSVKALLSTLTQLCAPKPLCTDDKESVPVEVSDCLVELDSMPETAPLGWAREARHFNAVVSAAKAAMESPVNHSTAFKELLDGFRSLSALHSSMKEPTLWASHVNSTRLLLMDWLSTSVPSLWLPGLSSPVALLTEYTRSHARAVGCAVDDIVLVGSFARDPSSPSLQLHGLLLVGSALLSDGSLAPLPSDANAIASKLDIPLTVSARTRTEAQSLWAHGKIPLFNAVVGNDPGTPLLHIALPADGKGKCTTGAVYLDVC